MNLIQNAGGRLVASCRTTNGGVNLEYYLYENKVGERSSYSIRAVTVVEGCRDEVQFDDVTSLESVALELFGIISENSVSSCTLGDVLEDVIG